MLELIFSDRAGYIGIIEGQRGHMASVGGVRRRKREGSTGVEGVVG